MSSLTAQESSETQPSNPVNKGTTSAPGTGTDTAGPFSTGAKRESGFDSGLSSKADKVHLHTPCVSTRTHHFFVTIVASVFKTLYSALHSQHQ